jgi:hypothetical protein
LRSLELRAGRLVYKGRANYKAFKKQEALSYQARSICLPIFLSLIFIAKSLARLRVTPFGGLSCFYSLHAKVNHGRP